MLRGTEGPLSGLQERVVIGLQHEGDFQHTLDAAPNISAALFSRLKVPKVGIQYLRKVGR